MIETNKRKGMLFAIAILGLLITVQARANEPAAPPLDQIKAEATVSDSDVQVAEPFQLELKVTAPKGTKVILPAIGDQFGEFDVLDIQDVADIPADGLAEQRIWTRRMSLESIVAGDLQIPVMKIELARGTESKTLNTKAITVRVLSVLEGRANPTQFRDIQPVIDVKIPQPESYRWVLWAAGGLGVASCMVAGTLLIAGRKTWLSPAQWATRELDALQCSQAMQANNSEAVTHSLSTVLRDFFELQFEISAPVQTTSELLSDVGHRQILPPELATQFGKLFTIADQTKFAGLSLSESQLNKVFEEARSVIVEAGQLHSETPKSETAVTLNEHLNRTSKHLTSSATPFKEPV